jgi:2-alkyl-3-oxoalkanoate reductase
VKIFVAGAGGTLGRPLVRALSARGHEVTGLTRSASRVSSIESDGGRGVMGDALDRDGLAAVLREAAPTHVVHALTALPAAGPLRSRDLRATNVVRVDGTRNLLRAAIAAGARRLVAESFLGVYGAADFDHPWREDEPFSKAGDGPLREAVEALRNLEDQLETASRSGAIETVALRFGGFYGPGVPSTEELVRQIRAGRLFAPGSKGLVSFVHIEDAVSATVAALEADRPGSLYNVVDDEPLSMRDFLALASEAFGGRPPRKAPSLVLRVLAPVIHEMASWSIPLSSAKAKQELGWRPSYPSAREGLRRTAVAMKNAA